MTGHSHFKIYKPPGVLSQFVNNQTKRKNKKLLGDLYDFPPGTMSIGRLDENSEGLLLLTTDGKLSERVRRKSVEKEYYVQVDGIINEEALLQITKGLEIKLLNGFYTTLPCRAKKLDPAPNVEAPKRKRSNRHGPTSWISIILTEGKFRQVRKMTAAVGFPTIRLIRVRIGNTHLGDFKPGDVQEYNPEDFQRSAETS